MRLPEAFENRMRCLLGDEFGEYLDSYHAPRHYALRVNTLKISPEAFRDRTPFHLTPVPWIPSGFYYEREDACAAHPYYSAGLYYIQEPSAMTPAALLDVRPGHRVLDMCAAPGGKATALGEKLKGQGVLVANDISEARCKALQKNLEVFGVRNAVVTNTVPSWFGKHFAGWFDRVLLDAPCSGEGMFRKDEVAVRTWSPEKSEECAKIQRSLILLAADLLKPGGMLMYSTCTFEPAENEEIIKHLLRERGQMHPAALPEREGFSPAVDNLPGCARLWPHKIGGEGHFLALLRKEGGEEEDAGRRGGESALSDRPAREEYIRSGEIRQPARGRWRAKDVPAGRRRGARTADREDAPDLQYARAFLEKTGLPGCDRMYLAGSTAYLAPDADLPDLSGIRYLRNGLLLGEVKKDRFEPSQALAMAMEAGRFDSVLSLAPEDDRTARYLRGETIILTERECERSDGWTLVCVDGFPLGWGKRAGSILKNKYLAGWRRTS